MDDLRWLGLDWDEGPGAGGDCGPESERRAREDALQTLRAQGKIYPCPDARPAARCFRAARATASSATWGTCCGSRLRDP